MPPPVADAPSGGTPLATLATPRSGGTPHTTRRATRPPIRGTVYLVHFIQGSREGKTHYVGFTQKPIQRRLNEHRTGKGAEFFGANCQFTLARTWQDQTMAFELQLKKEGHLKRHCPTCKRGGEAIPPLAGGGVPPKPKAEAG